MARQLHGRVALTAAVVAIAGAAWIAPRVSSARLRPTDFDVDLRRVETEIGALSTRAALTPGASSGSPDVDSPTRLAYALFRRATLTGRAEDFASTQATVDQVRTTVGTTADLSLLQAMLDVRVHRLDAARRALALAPDLASNPEALALAADIDLQDGRYDAASARYEELARMRPTFDILSRLAHVAARRGATDEADRLYEAAEDDVTAKNMRAYAWIELQRGYTQFSRGRYDAALAHYRQARRAYSGYWLVDEYMAELMGARRQFADAIELYRRAIARAPRPDLLQQLGDLYLFMGRPRDAKPWHDAALAGYLASARDGEVHFFHHLAGFYSDVVQDGREAIAWAAKDAALRHNASTDDTLAWALYRGGRIAEATDAADRAIASGMADAHAYAHAATIHAAAGRHDHATRLTATLAQINPRFSDFHVHR